MSTRFVQFIQGRRVRVVAGVALSVGLMTVLMLVLPFTGPASAEVSEANTGAAVASNNALRVTAARAISIPFGIASTQEISDSGMMLSLSGHGVCWEEGQLFDLRARVAQSTTNAFAEARTIDICNGGQRQMWGATTFAGSQTAFEPGLARICAEAVEYATHGVGDEYMRCKDVELVEALAEGY